MLYFGKNTSVGRGVLTGRGPYQSSYPKSMQVRPVIHWHAKKDSYILAYIETSQREHTENHVRGWWLIHWKNMGHTKNDNVRIGKIGKPRWTLIKNVSWLPSSFKRHWSPYQSSATSYIKNVPGCLSTTHCCRFGGVEVLSIVDGGMVVASRITDDVAMLLACSY